MGRGQGGNTAIGFIMKTIIIDDERFVREDLKEMLSLHADITVAGEAETISAAVALLSIVEPDIVFLDIQLRGGSGFDLVPYIHPTVDIIFFTSHDEYAVRAFEVNALDFLLKPVAPERLSSSLDRVRENRSTPLSSSGFTGGPFNEDDRIFIRTDKEQRFIALNGIVAVVSEGGNYSSVFLENNAKYLVRRPLKEWKNILPVSTFIRIHRSTIVNLNRIRQFVREKSGKYHVRMSGYDDPLKVSRRKVPKLKEKLGEFM